MAMPSIVVSTALDNTAVTDSPPLRYGTPVILQPLRSMNSSPTMCGKPPAPVWA